MLSDWSAAAEAEEVKLPEVVVDGVSAYFIHRESFADCVSSWRRSVLLPKGNYYFEARSKTESVVPIPDDQGRGAGIRRINSGRSNELVGTHDWEVVRYEIEVLEDQRYVELVLELRARHGAVWFDRESLPIRRVPSRT